MSPIERRGNDRDEDIIMSKEHSSSESGRTQSRREFLKNVVLGGGATAVALMTREVAVPPQPEPEAAKQPESQGYRVTPHIEHYYRTAGL
ncbi:MAG TPA: twin-arginine translocation signal domain-containing protein [Albitalea sp.]|nr:twin-arginine translocation signal domain-containing protein [Albitalea sp.]